MDSIFDSFLAHAKQNDRNDIVVAVPLPAPRAEIIVRPATMEDCAFLDSLQKMHSHMVGFFPRKQMEAYVKGEHVLIAEEHEPQRHGDTERAPDGESHSTTSQQKPFSVPPRLRGSLPLGYVIYKDQYLKRDDVGIIYQLNVVPLKQRHLIGATLIKAVFDRSAYGCKLYGCWCAQDIQANYFWESIGFVPLAFRTGSRTKQRIHIYWQKRIREGDETTPYWYPHQTSGGAVAEDRIVLPIPPGTHWRDAKPLVLPGITPEPQPEVPTTLPGGAPIRVRPEMPEPPKVSPRMKLQIYCSESKHLKGCPPGKGAVFTTGGVKYVERGDYVPELPAEPEKPKKRTARPRMKHDAKHLAAARELRDRILDEINSGRMLPSPTEPKYEVARQLEAAPRDSAAQRSTVRDDRLLDAA